MGESKKTWYESNKELVIKSTRGSIKGILSTFWAPKLFTGKASVGFLSRFLLGLFEENDRKVLIIVDKNLEKSAIRVENTFKRRGFKCKIWKGVEPEVPLHTAQDALNICNQFKPKILIAIGGGSAIDTAKLIFLLYEKPDIDFYNKMPFESLGLRKKIKQFVVIPTTSGTGSEASFGSMVMDTSQPRPIKVHVTFLELLPDIAVLAPEFVINMPPWLTAGTGIDALVHAMSSYLCPGQNFLGDNASLGAIKLVMQYLPRAYNRGRDIEAREKMQYAAFLAGLTITNIGLSLDHSLGHALGNIYHSHHGISVGIFISYVIQFLAKTTDRYINFAPFFNVKIKNRSKEEILKNLIKKYKDFLESLNLPTSIKELKDPIIQKKDFLDNLEQLTELAWADICNFSSFRVPSKGDLRNLFLYAYDGKDVDF